MDFIMKESFLISFTVLQALNAADRSGLIDDAFHLAR